MSFSYVNCQYREVVKGEYFRPDYHSSDSSASISEEDTSAKPIPANERFDVFLSFRGRDTRKTFVGHLDHFLSAAGVLVFLDSKKLEKGKKIEMSLMHAIRNSDILIPIFSKNYAYSSWCLTEMSAIKRAPLKRLSTNIATEAEPTRRQLNSGGFSGISGLSLLDDFNGHEIQLFKTLRTQILSKLAKLPLEVAKHPVGVEERKNVAMDLLEMKSETIIISLCIHGMGGVGKNTLAKALFNDLRPKFSATCFMSDVRKTDTKELQMNIITSLVNIDRHDVKINSPEEGMSLMKKHLATVHALLVLDDVGHRELLTVLLGDLFRPGSRIIVTTRNKGVLDQRSNHLNRFYQVEGLDDDQALQLFIWQAFPERFLDKKYQRLSEQVVKSCQGLPLAIEVIGGLLFDEKDPQFYDVLNDTEKEICLDIACFFVGSDKYKCLYVWEASGWCANSALDNLQMRCLIKVSSDDRLEMHDILRDMGRSIVTKQSISDIGEHSRLWDEKDVRKVFKQNRATKSIQGILYTSSKRKSFRTEQLEAMHNLRLLSLNNAIIEGDFGRIPTSELRWLRWIDCPLECLPSELKMKNIAVLEVTQSRQIRQVWVDEQMHPKIPKNLKILRIADCFNLERIPEFSKLRSLNIARFCWLSSDKPKAFGFVMLFESLVKLDLSVCTSLKTLPDSIGDLINLEYLDLSRCKNLEGLPRSIGSLVRLRFLNMYSNFRVTCLPEEFVRLVQLEELNISKCERLVKLPDSFGNLCNLTILRMVGMSNLNTLPESLSCLGALRILEVVCCVLVHKLPKHIGMLNSLEVVELSLNYFHTLPKSIKDLSKVTKLDLRYCRKLRELPVLPEKLVELVIDECQHLRRVPDLSNLKHLEILGMHKCEKVEGLPGLGSLQALVHLDIGGCKNIKSVAGVEGLKSLQTLHLGGSGVAFFHKWIKAINGQVMPRLWELSVDAKPFRDWFAQQIQTAPPSLDENGEGDRQVFESTQFTSGTSFNRYRDFGGEEVRLFICQENDEFVRSLQNGDIIRVRVIQSGLKNAPYFENVRSPIFWINFLSSTGEEIIRSGDEESSEQQNSKLYCELFRDMARIEWSYNAWRNLHPLDLDMRSLAVYDLAGFRRRTFDSKSLVQGSGNVAQETVFVRCKRENRFEVGYAYEWGMQVGVREWIWSVTWYDGMYRHQGGASPIIRAKAEHLLVGFWGSNYLKRKGHFLRVSNLGPKLLKKEGPLFEGFCVEFRKGGPLLEGFSAEWAMKSVGKI
eukprot:Gb_24679 [translate_table: standard]